MTSYALAIDQGTTSSRTIVFRADMTIVAIAQEELPQHYRHQAGSSTTRRTSGAPYSQQLDPHSPRQDSRRVR